MLAENDIEDIFGDFEFPNIDNPIGHNGDSENLTEYLTKLSEDEEFLSTEAEKLGKEVSEILHILEENEIS